jgi:thymidine kinase
MKIDYLVCNDVRPMQKLDTYSFIMDFRGGTYCSQVQANSIKSALREWLKLIRVQQDEIKFLTEKVIDEMKEKLVDVDNAPVLLNGMTNFWTTLLLTRMGSVNLHIVLTK